MDDISNKLVGTMKIKILALLLALVCAQAGAVIFLPAAIVGGGGVPVVEGWAQTDTGTFTPSTIDLIAPSGITSGELLLILSINRTATQTDTFNTPAGWTKEYYFSHAATDSTIVLYWKEADGTEGDITISNTDAGARMGGYYVRISGANTTSPFDVRGSGVTELGGDTSRIVLSETTTVSDTLGFIIGHFRSGDTEPITAASPWAVTDAFTVGSGNSGLVGYFGTQGRATAGAMGDADITIAINKWMGSFQFAIAPE